MHKAVFFIFLFFSFELAVAQHYNFSNIGTNKGLPSYECYGLMQDSKGYMWIRTLNGLCKYNGRNFKLFTKKEGLKSNSIYAIYEDKIGRIWFATASSHIGYILNDSIHYIPSSPKFAKENGYGQKVFFQIVSDKDMNIYVASHERAYKINAKDNYSTYHFYTKRDNFLSVIDINNYLFCIPDTASFLRALKVNKLKINVLGKDMLVTWDEIKLKQGIVRNVYPCKDRNGGVFFNLSNRVLYIDNKGNSKEVQFENLIFHLFIDRDNNLWIGLNSGGLLKYENADLNKPAQVLLKDETISGIAQDFEGGIWVSSLSNGIFYCKNLYNENLINNAFFNYKPEMLKIIDSSLFVSDFNSSVVKLNIPQQKAEELNIKFENTKIGILDIDKVSDGYILSGRNCLYKINHEFKSLERVNWEKKLTLSAGSYNTITTSNNEIIGISKNSIINYSKGYRINLPTFGNDLIEYNHKLIVGTKNALLYFNSPNTADYNKLIDNEQIVKLLKIDERLIVICRDGKVTLFDTLLKPKHFLIDNVSLNDACLYSHNHLIMASNVGIYVLNFETNEIRRINSSDGILDNEVFKIAAYKNDAYYSTIYGIGKFSIDQLKPNYTAPKIVLSRTSTNENENFKTGNVYPYNSSFSFKFDLISFKDYTPPRLYYKLNGYDKSWKTNESGEINYTNLTDGKYVLVVYARNEAGINSRQLHLPFVIEIPFTKTWWFGLIILCLLLLISYVIYKVTYYFINKREVNKTRINKMLAEYQLIGLKAQMNPHFIFNCLNSIQKYVLEHDSKLAYTYMAKFSKLIRFVLDISDKTFVALTDELELVKIYAELEQLRFDKKFSFSIEVQDSIKADEIMVPSMLIQPYLENAIWHGIMNLPEDKKGEVKIEVKSTDERIEIVIADNGVGRNKAKLLNQRTHQSKGLSINQKRIEAINYLLKSNNATVELADLYDLQNEPAGTLVTIKLPLKYDE